ncbi:MAG TPA: AraC family transcriptional regulator [Candidatus Egerieimonas faecigallinarum]|nr:AraC family transcriptional regulator [Candidatus Egerieimonas faecigallinarum]
MNFEHELIVPDQGFPFKLFLFEGKDGGYVRDRHWHRSIEIFALYEGELTFHVNDEKYPLHPGEFILLNSNEVHSISSPRPNRTIVLQIPLSLFENYYTDEGLVLFTHSPRKQDGQIMELIGEMYDAMQGRETGYEWKVQSEFFALIYLLVTKYRKEQVSPELVRRHRKMTRLSVITAYIRDNYTREISLEKLADIFGYSPAYLSRMFRKYAGTNYKSYLQSVRLENAVEELVNTDSTISDIALRHGFANSKSFSGEFRKKYGIMPSEYRRRKTE